jgi:uncharacterized protein (TIGR03435 family)
MRCVVICVLLASSAGAAAFDVATVKPSSLRPSGAEGSKRARIEYTPKSLTMRNVDLLACVEWAYDLPAYRISAPDSMSRDAYDVVGKTDTPVDVLHLRAMLQDLLVKRFRLTLHRETRPVPVYELSIAREGPKLPAPKPATELQVKESLPRVQDGSFIFENASLADFAEKLSLLRGVDLPVIDRTGIPGVYDIVLKSAASALLQPDAPPVATFVREQLGLKMTAAKVPMEVTIIDHFEKPGPDVR